MQSSAGCEAHGMAKEYVAPPEASDMPAYVLRTLRQRFTERTAIEAAASRRAASSVSWSSHMISFTAMSGRDRPFFLGRALRCSIANTSHAFEALTSAEGPRELRKEDLQKG